MYVFYRTNAAFVVLLFLPSERSACHALTRDACPPQLLQEYVLVSPDCARIRGTSAKLQAGEVRAALATAYCAPFFMALVPLSVVGRCTR